MKPFRKIVVLDRILLSDSQRLRLRDFADQITEYSGLDAAAVLRRLEAQMEEKPRPMCWTQLAQEEVTTDELNRRLQGADAVITCWTGITDDVILANPQLRYIGFWTNLAQHRINVDLARSRGIHLTYLPDYGTESVAEMTFAGILAVCRRVLRNAKDTERGKWPYELLKTGTHSPRVEEIRERLLAGRSLGVVGFGRIGRRVAELALAFRMRVQYFSRHRYPEWENRGVEYSPLEELFSTSDVVSIHLSPYGPERFVNAELIARLRNGALFVNTSAGRLVDQEALLTEVERGRIYVYLDVYEGLPPRTRLKRVDLYENLFTYRSGWFTREAILEKGEMLLRNMEEFLAGRTGTQVVENEMVVSEDVLERPCIGFPSLD